MKETKQRIKDTKASKDAILSAINDIAGSMSCSDQIKRGRLDNMLLKRTRNLLWLESHLRNNTYKSII